MIPKKKENLEAKDSYIPINKGHFELDTDQRKNNFEKKLSKGWEDEYHKYSSLWTSLAKNKEISDYPVLIDLELSSKCNLRCPMCYTTTDEFLEKVSLKFMDINLIKKIILEVSGKIYALRLSLRGESTLNPNFIEAVKFAKENGIKEVSTLTHGKKLTGNFLRKLVDAGIDWITVSIDGMHEDYNNIRRPLTWEGTLGRLKEIQDLKKQLNREKPVIKVQGIWPSIRKYPTEYYESLLPYTDLIAYNPLIDYLGNDTEIIYEDNFSCPQLYQRIVVGSDGNVLLCANDEEGRHFIGNANFQSIHEIWHGSKMNEARELHSQKDGFKEIPVCKDCYYPRKAIPDETAQVGDREITIHNYVNRAQEVGK